MQYLVVVERLESASHLDDYSPQLLLREVGSALDVGVDLAHEVASLRVLHHDAQRAAAVLEKGLLVGDDVRMAMRLVRQRLLDRREDAGLVDCVFLLFLR